MKPADWFLATALTAIIGGAALLRAGELHPVLYQYQAGDRRPTDVWFSADLPKYACLIDGKTAAARDGAPDHPLLGIVMHGAAAIVGGSVQSATTLRRIPVLFAAAWTMVFVSLLLRVGLQRADAVLFCLLGAASGAGIFWMAVPESFVIGSVTLLLPLWLIAGQRTPGKVAETTVSAASLAITITNWMSGLLMSFARHRWRDALRIAVNALVALSLIWGVQWLWYRDSTYFGFSTRSIGYAIETFGETLPHDVAQTFMAGAVVTPAIVIQQEEDGWRGLSIQKAALFSSIRHAALTLGWLGLLVAGASRMVRQRPLNSFAVVLLGTTVGQLLMHAIAGTETFLYSMHFVPLLVLIASHAALGGLRTRTRGLMTVLIVAIAANNLDRFVDAAQFVRQLGEQAKATGAVISPAIGCPE